MKSNRWVERERERGRNIVKDFGMSKFFYDVFMRFAFFMSTNSWTWLIVWLKRNVSINRGFFPYPRRRHFYHSFDQKSKHTIPLTRSKWLSHSIVCPLLSFKLIYSVNIGSDISKFIEEMRRRRCLVELTKFSRSRTLVWAGKIIAGQNEFLFS